MMMRKFIFSTFIVFTALIVNTTFGQDTTEIQRKVIVIKNDGAKYSGYILSDDAREILLNSEEVGKLYIPKHHIKSIKPYEPEKNEEVLEENSVIQEEPIEEVPQEVTNNDKVSDETTNPKVEINKNNDSVTNYITTKNIISDNALPLQRGESFIKFMPLGVEAGIPLTKNWSLGAFSSYWGLPVGLKTKYSFKLSEEAHLSLDLGYGTMAFGTWADYNIDDGGGVISTTLTFGDRYKNFSVKTGYGFFHETWEDWDWDETTQQAIHTGSFTEHTHVIFANFGGMIQLNDRLTFVFDAVGAFLNGSILVGGGAAARFGQNPRRKWQLGGSLFYVDGGFLPVILPHISYTFVFSERNRQ